MRTVISRRPASASRAGALLLVLEMMVLLVPALWRLWHSRKLRAGSRFPRRAANGPAGFLVAAVAAASLAGIGTLWGRLQLPDPLQFRREIADSTVAMIRERPLHGFGLGTFAQVYPGYATFDAGALVEHAHDDWLEWTAEGGIPFAVVWLLLASTLVRPALHSSWATGSQWAMGLLAIFLHALVDYPFAKFGLTAWIFALAGMLQAQGERTPSPNALTLQTQQKEIFL